MAPGIVGYGFWGVTTNTELAGEPAEVIGFMVLKKQMGYSHTCANVYADKGLLFSLTRLSILSP